MKQLIWAACLLSVAGCGRQEESSSRPEEEIQAPQTPYGSVEEVRSYLEKINPYIQEIGRIQAEVDHQVGSSGKATSKNLATAMKEVYPRLREVLENFERIEPPPLLAPFHRDIEKLMLIRLDAYDTTIKGWQEEQKSRNTQWHQEAEAKLKQANELIVQLNAEMKKINDALSAAARPSQLATP